MIDFVAVQLKDIFEQGKDFPWVRPVACLRCHHYKVWSHGFVPRFFYGFVFCLYMKCYRCPQCRCVMTSRPDSHFSRIRCCKETIRALLAFRIMQFDNRKWIARKKYRSFVEDGIRQGKRDELVGGGLRRSRKLSGSEEFEAYDERILGSGNFVEQLQQETQTSGTSPSTVSLEEIIRSIAHIYSIEPASIRQGGKRKDLSTAKGAFCYITVIKMGINGALVARTLNVSRAGVSMAARRGEEIYKVTPALHNIVTGLQT